uniref:Hemagglutinin-esterase-fusion glycoprotein n=1 Tax=Salamander influenza-like virus TaxID=2777034 RepID=A0A866W0A8_9ORTO|nr:hemagglutinin [Salamander influenza-like virus]
MGGPLVIGLIILLLKVASTTSATSKICVGAASGEGAHTVKTISHGDVKVTGVRQLTTELTPKPFGKLRGRAGESMLCPTCTGCEDLDVALATPTCNGQIQPADYRIIHEQFPKKSKCYAALLDETNIRALPNKLKGYKNNRWIEGPLVNVGGLEGGPYNPNVVSACPDASGASSFYRTLSGITPVSKTEMVLSKVRVPHSCTGNETMVFVWGFWNQQPDTSQADLGVSVSQMFSSAKQDKVVHYSSRIAGMGPLAEVQMSTGQGGRITMIMETLEPEEELTLGYQRGFLPPRGYWCSSSKIPTIRGPKVPSTVESDCLDSHHGGYNKTTPFYTGKRAPSIGNCSLWSKAELKVVNGTRARGGPMSRGLWGAITGFFTGGFDGMAQGWLGTSSTGTHGTAVAADFESTKKAVDKINNNLNTLSRSVEEKLKETGGLMAQLHGEILSVDGKVEDLRADVFAHFIELEVMMANDGILNDETEALQALQMKAKAQLGPSAVDVGNGCFYVKHVCNQSCVDSISKGNYTPIDYGLPAFETPEVTAANLVGLTTNDILIYYAVAASSTMLAIAIAGFIMFLVSKGNLRCTVCI